jgi:hypothetical protein
MTMNNTPFNWNNKTEFVPSKPQEKTMSTYDYLNNAEGELRNALKSTTDLSNVYQLRRIVDTISTVNEIKNQFNMSVTENKKVKDGFFQREDQYDVYNNINLGTPFPGSNSPDNLILG